MKPQILLCVLLLMSPITVCAQESKMEGKNQAQAWISGLAERVEKGEVGKVEILQIPPQVLTRTRITPDMLEKQYHYKFTIRDVRGGTKQERIAKAMKSTSVQPQSEMPDLRWGVIFYDIDDKRLAAIYLNKAGDQGAVGNEPIALKGEFFKWLDGDFSSCFR